MRIEKKENGLYQAKLALDGVDTVNSTIQSVSGILQGNINTATGNISTVSGNLNSVSGNVNKLLSYARSNSYARQALHNNPILTTNVVDSRQLINTTITSNGNLVNTLYIGLVSFSINVASGSPSVHFYRGTTSTVADHSGIAGITGMANFQNGLLYTKLFVFDDQSADTWYFSTAVLSPGTITNYNLYTFQIYAIQLPPESAY